MPKDKDKQEKDMLKGHFSMHLLHALSGKSKKKKKKNIYIYESDRKVPKFMHRNLPDI